MVELAQPEEIGVVLSTLRKKRKQLALPALHADAILDAIKLGEKSQLRVPISFESALDLSHAEGRWTYCASSTNSKWADSFFFSYPDESGKVFSERGREICIQYKPPYRLKESLEVTGPSPDSSVLVAVADMSIERVMSISEADAFSEGVHALDGLLSDSSLCFVAKILGIPASEARVWFAQYFIDCYGFSAWAENPFVLKITLARPDIQKLNTRQAVKA